MTVLLVLTNTVVFLWQSTLPEPLLERFVLTAGAIPREIVTLRDYWPAAVVPVPLTIFTSMFIHGGLMHLIGNMWFLWIFGDNVEDRLGRLRFLFFYLLTGAIGAFAQSLMMPTSNIPMIGASGAVAGVLGGYILTFPHSRVVTLILWYVVGVPAWIFLGIWFVGQFFIGDGSGIAWMAHVGGFLAGLGLVRLFTPAGRPVVIDDEYYPPRRRR
jgi:membrane associated rhomboid family serine protease